MFSGLGKKISNEQFDIRIKNLNFIRVDDYVNTNISITFKCKICGKSFKKKPKDIVNLKCKCVEKYLKYQEILSAKNLTSLNYYNMRTEVLHKCNMCKNEFLATPKSVINSAHDCQFCSGLKLNNVEYTKRLPSDIILSDNYVNSYTKIKHLCNVCLKYWYTKPNYILHMGCGCPYCASSKGEKLISYILTNLNIEFIKQKSILINNKKYYYDFYITYLNLAIEYDGIQHFEATEFFGGYEQYLIRIQNDKLKNDYSVINNINIIRIPYYEIENSKEIILDGIKQIENNNGYYRW